ncbi:MAG: flagellar biosynthesis protein FlgA [Actinophytocola sp.]|nr:flagellar biosynthesis protein FlgA [Actinophytocola sp.]
MPYLLLGVILVVACAAAAMVVSTQVDDRRSVLVLARPVSVGQLLSTQDLRQVAISTDVGLDAVPAGDSATVLGHPVAYSLPTGALLTRGSVGAPAIPATGQAVAAVALTAGQFPPALAPGARVAVLVSATSSTAGTPSTNESAVAAPVAQWAAMVVDVGASGADQQTTVVSLQLAEVDARQLAVAPTGQIDLVVLSGGGS